MTSPAFIGIHYVKFPITDVEANAAWFEKAFGACWAQRFDCCEKDGTFHAVMPHLLGVGAPVEFCHASKAAEAVDGYNPATFGMKDKDTLEQWMQHLDAVGVKHSPMFTGHIGRVIGVDTPGGLAIRIHTEPVGSFEHVKFHPEQAQIVAASMVTPLTQRS